MLAGAVSLGVLVFLEARLRALRARKDSFFGCDEKMAADVVFLTCRELLEAGSASSATWAVAGLDELNLFSKCAERGLRFHVRRWDEEGVAWGAYKLAVIRTTWDYSASEARAFAFTRQLARLAREGVRVLNNERIAAWNVHKAYLGEVTQWWSDRGGTPQGELEVCAIPSVLLPADAPLEAIDLGAIMRERGWRDVFIKPAVGGGSRGCCRVLAREGAGALAAGQAFLERHVRGELQGRSSNSSALSRVTLVRGVHEPHISVPHPLEELDRLIAEAPLALAEGSHGSGGGGSAADGGATPLPPQDMMILPYLPTVESQGETSVVYLGGRVSHVVSKRPRPGDFRCQEEFGALASCISATPQLEKLTDRVLEAVCSIVETTQPRLDSPRSPSGAPFSLPAALPPKAIVCARVDLLPLTPELHGAVFGADGRGAGRSARVPSIERTPYLILEIGARAPQKPLPSPPPPTHTYRQQDSTSLTPRVTHKTSCFSQS